MNVIQYEGDAVHMGEWGILRIGKTYHRNGFFNETDQTPRFPRPENLVESNILLECIGSTSSDTVEAKVRYKNKIGTGSWINLDHKARIYGGRLLSRWFEANIGLDEEVRIEAVEPLKQYRVTDLKALAGKASLLRKPEAEICGSHDALESGRRGTTGPAITASKFEEVGREVMEETFGVTLRKRALPGIPKVFDMVSPDGTLVGDAKFFTMVRGQDPPSAKFSIIAEYVWLLERTSAARKFLVFGNDRRVPVEWLRRFGHLAQDVEFYFLEVEGRRLSSLGSQGIEPRN